MFSPATRRAFVFRLRKRPPDLKKPKPFAIENLAPKVPGGRGATPRVLQSLRCALRGNVAVGCQEEGGGPLAVGTKSFNVGFFEALQDFRARVAEGVAAAGADDSFLWRGGG